MYETELVHIKELTGEFSDEYWTVASPSGELWIDRDRTDDWASYAEAYAPDRYHLWWPSRVRDAVVRVCVEVETQAMNAALADMAHTERPPRWFPAVSKIAIPPEDRQPYPYGAFAEAKQRAFRRAADDLHTIEQSCVELHLNQLIGRTREAGWQFAVDDRGPEPAIELYPDDQPPVMAVLVTKERLIVNHDGLARYNRDITTEDLKFLGAIEGAIDVNVGAGRLTSPMTSAAIAQFEARRSPAQPPLPGMPAPPPTTTGPGTGRDLTEADPVAHDAYATAAYFATSGATVTVLGPGDLVALAFPAEADRHPVDTDPAQPKEATPDQAPQM